MPITVNLTPVNPDAALAKADFELQHPIAMAFANPHVRIFAVENKRAIGEFMLSIDPAAMPPQDYHDTMKHLNGLMNLWDGIIGFCDSSTTAIRQDNEKENA